MRQTRVKDVLYQDEEEEPEEMKLDPRIERKLFRKLNGKKRRR